MGDPPDECIHRAGAAGRTDKMIGNTRRVAFGIISGKNFYFGVQKRLRAFLNPIFMGGATLSVTPYGVPAPRRGSQGLRLIAEGLKYNEKVSRSSLASPFGRGVTAGDGEGACRCPCC